MNSKKFLRFSLLPTLFLGAHSVLAATVLPNPLGDVTDPDVVVANVIKVFLGVVGTIAVLIFIYGGFMMVISRGNPEKVKSGQDALVWATIGLIIIFGSYGIVQLIFQSVGLGS